MRLLLIESLPADWREARLLGRFELPEGPAPVLVQNGRAYDLSAAVEDRDEPGRGFTHKVGDVVRVSSARLGTLVNTVATCESASPWNFGIGALMRNPASRNLL
jgi:fumarylacetoacetate (FAA) hydrolase family protein